jgi:hypothetical protein
MNWGNVLSISAVTMLGLALLPGNAVSQQRTLKEQIVGTWTVVSTVNVQKDGSKVDQFGANPKGSITFDGNGRYMLIIVRSDLPKFAADKADEGSADENKAVLKGLIAHFGTYSINEADKTLTTRVEASSFPNLSGKEQKRTITSLTANELKYTNPTTVFGNSAEVVWRRAK